MYTLIRLSMKNTPNACIEWVKWFTRTNSIKIGGKNARMAYTSSSTSKKRLSMDSKTY